MKVLFLIAIIACALLIKNGMKKKGYTVVIVPHNVSHKPEIPLQHLGTHLIIINQSVFPYKTNPITYEYEFRVIDKSLSIEDLKVIGKEMIPKNAIVNFYIF